MLNKSALNKLFNDIRENMLELINMIEVKIDVGYILEELEELSYKIKKLNPEGIKISQEIMSNYKKLYKRYKDRLASYLSQKEASQLINRINIWIQILVNSL
ncbi:MAG: hypothetical protein ACTSSG_02625 [Candidatus Heimdallarchaeaceae archaeon]